jgi:hypothetical protein
MGVEMDTREPRGESGGGEPDASSTALAVDLQCCTLGSISSLPCSLLQLDARLGIGDAMVRWRALAAEAGVDSASQYSIEVDYAADPTLSICAIQSPPPEPKQDDMSRADRPLDVEECDFRRTMAAGRVLPEVARVTSISRGPEEVLEDSPAPRPGAQDRLDLLNLTVDQLKAERVTRDLSDARSRSLALETDETCWSMGVTPHRQKLSQDHHLSHRPLWDASRL